MRYQATLLLVTVLLAPVLVRAQNGWDGYPVGNYVTNYLTWEEYDDAFGEHPFSQCVSALRERQRAAGLSLLSIVHTGVQMGPLTNLTSISLTNTWGWFTNAGYVGYENMKESDLRAFDTALAATVPYFCDTNYLGKTNMPTISGTPYFPKWTMQTLFRSNSIAYNTTNDYGFTRWPTSHMNQVLCQKAYNGTWHDAGIWFLWGADYSLGFRYHGEGRPVLRYQSATNIPAGTATVSGSILNQTTQTRTNWIESVAVSTEYTALTSVWSIVTNITYSATPNTGDVVSVLYTNDIALYVKAGDDAGWSGGAAGGEMRTWQLFPELFDERQAVLNAMVATEVNTAVSALSSSVYIYAYNTTNDGGSFVVETNQMTLGGAYVPIEQVAALYPAMVAALHAAWNPDAVWPDVTSSYDYEESASQTSIQEPYGTNRSLALKAYAENWRAVTAALTTNYTHDFEFLVEVNAPGGGFYDVHGLGAPQGGWMIYTNVSGSTNEYDTVQGMIVGNPADAFPTNYSVGSSSWGQYISDSRWRVWWNNTNGGFRYQ